MSENIKAAQEVHHKLEFYFVALAFTTVGFATQTGHFTGTVMVDLTETAAWLFLIASGAIGLSRLEMIPVIYKNHTQIDDRKNELKGLEKDERYIKSFDKVKELESIVKNLEMKNFRKYDWQKRLLLFGLCALVFSRIMVQFLKTY